MAWQYHASSLHPWPNKHEDRVGWNQRWEEVLDSTYSYNGGVPAKLERAEAAAARTLPRSSLLLSANDVCSLQRKLNYASARAFARNDIENIWRSSTQERREELALEGLYRASCVGTGSLEHKRIWCPDMTVRNLAGVDTDLDFIALMKRFLPADRLTNDLLEPVMIEDEKARAVVEASIETNEDPTSKKLKLAKLTHMDRCYFITKTVYGMLMAFLGLEEEAQPRSQLVAYNPKPMKVRVKEVEGKLPTNLLQHIDEGQVSAATCDHCEKNNKTVMKEGRRLKPCPRCKKAGRWVWYCSRECQIAEWKSGLPTPHRTICGTSGAVEAAPLGDTVVKSSLPEGLEVKGNRWFLKFPKSDARSMRMLPKPDPSFKRPPALLYQIMCLTENRPKHYCLYDTNITPGEALDSILSMDLTDFANGSAFLFLRYRAMRDGFKSAVINMYKFLDFALRTGNHSWPSTLLKLQLEREYGVNLDDVVLDVQPPIPMDELLPMSSLKL